jgi:hypothetical protein
MAIIRGVELEVLFNKYTTRSQYMVRDFGRRLPSASPTMSSRSRLKVVRMTKFEKNRENKHHFVSAYKRNWLFLSLRARYNIPSF